MESGWDTPITQKGGSGTMPHTELYVCVCMYAWKGEVVSEIRTHPKGWDTGSRV